MSELDRIATAQHGAVGVAQLRSIGWSKRRVQLETRRGRIEALRLGAVRLAGTHRCWEQVAMGALLAVGDDAWLSHDSAARLWCFDAWPVTQSIDVLAVGDQRPRGDGVRGHRTLWLPASQRTTRRGIPATTVERTFIDACGSVGPIHLERTGDDLLRRNLMRLPTLVRVYEDVPVSGRRKRRPVGGYLADRVDGFDPCESPAELDVLRELERHGRPLPVPQHRTKAGGRTYRIDFAYPELMEALEWQSVAHHTEPSALFADSARTQALQRAGWRVWPLTKRTTLGELLAIVDEVHRR